MYVLTLMPQLWGRCFVGHKQESGVQLVQSRDDDFCFSESIDMIDVLNAVLKQGHEHSPKSLGGAVICTRLLGLKGVSGG